MDDAKASKSPIILKYQSSNCTLLASRKTRSSEKEV
jgi:hypothetical protein